MPLSLSQRYEIVFLKLHPLDPSTVRRRLRESGGTYGPPLKKPLLTDKHREQRLIWARQHQHFNWDNVVTKIVRTVKYPLKLHVWGCFSKQGFGKLIIFRHNLTGDFMCDIYENCLLPTAYRQFPEGPDSWILQEDNDLKHRSWQAINWKTDNQIQVLPWPSASPDQNPIENVWSIMKDTIGKKNIQTIQELEQEIRKTWKGLPVGLAVKLVDSMDRRVQCLIEANGDYTSY
ncbi:unnamed protein product [Rotaria sp. Silwood2]|nr:unnamed protein product [Rotaria sp. Silwood2]